MTKNLNFNFKKETTSSWSDSTQLLTTRSLDQNIQTDVCVVGAGIAGLTSAYLLSQKGFKVCLLEMREIASGQTGRTSAHLVTALDRRYSSLVRIHGKDGARLAAESHRAAIETIEKIIRSENISCDFKYLNGYLESGDQKSAEELDEELKACHEIGLSEVHFVEEIPGKEKSKPALCFPLQAQFHPLKYSNALTKILIDQGVQIFTHTAVCEIEGGANAWVKTTEGFIVDAKQIVVATNSPINNTFAIHTKQAPYRSYVISAMIPKGSFDFLWWDTDEPFHYVRSIDFNSSHDLLIVGGGDHKTGQNDHPEQAFKDLEVWARAHFSGMEDIVHSWSGQVMETIDGLAYLGHNPGPDKNVYVITGDSGNGLTHATIGAILICDLIENKKNPWMKLYSPARIHWGGLKDFIKENINVAGQYSEWFTPKTVDSLKGLDDNSGVVLNLGLKKIAVYKNDHGLYEFYSAVCPHLGCVVAWNGVESSWDCPCHGSRFDCHGKVVEGPAQSDLPELDAPLDKQTQMQPSF